MKSSSVRQIRGGGGRPAGKRSGRRLTAGENLDGAREVGCRGRGTAEGEDFARREGLLGRFGE